MKKINDNNQSVQVAPEQKNIKEKMIDTLTRHFAPIWEDELFDNIGMQYDRKYNTLIIGQWWKRKWLWKATITPTESTFFFDNTKSDLIDSDYMKLIRQLQPELFFFLWEDDWIIYFEYGKMPKVA